MENGGSGGAGLPLGIVGTFHWTAPEVLRGEEFSEFSDVYSLGCVLWETVTGRIPHSQFSAFQTLGLVGYGRVRLDPIREPKNLALLIQHITKDEPPSQRPTSASVAQSLTQMANFHLEDSLERFFTFSPQ